MEVDLIGTLLVTLPLLLMNSAKVVVLVVETTSLSMVHERVEGFTNLFTNLLTNSPPVKTSAVGLKDSLDMKVTTFNQCASTLKEEITMPNQDIAEKEEKRAH
jgi:hypothetical protein